MSDVADERVGLGGKMTVSENVQTAQQTQTRARARRLPALDTDRAARDARIEATVHPGCVH